MKIPMRDGSLKIYKVSLAAVLHDLYNPRNCEEKVYCLDQSHYDGS